MARTYDIPYFDAHCDTLTCTGDSPLRENGGHLDLLRLHRYRTAGQVFAIFADGAKYPGEDAWRVCRHYYERFQSETERNRDLVAVCRTGEDARRAAEEGKVAAFLSIEGAELLGCAVKRLEEAERWGVRLINLTWNHANAIAGSHMDEPERGLSPLGRRFVKEMENRHILPDVSHLSERAFWDLAEMAEKPIVASHSDAKAVSPHSRNLTDEQIKAVIRSGGFIGLNAYTEFVGGKADTDALLAHAEHMLSLGAEDTLGFGSDWDGCDTLAAGLTGVQDMPRIYEELLRRNYSETLVRKIFYGNLLRVLA